MAVKLSWLFDRTCRPDGACGNWHSQFYKHYLVSICLDFDTGFDGFDTSWFRYVTSFLLNPSHFVPSLLNPAPLRTQPKSFRATQGFDTPSGFRYASYSTQASTRRPSRTQPKQRTDQTWLSSPLFVYLVSLLNQCPP